MPFNSRGVYLPDFEVDTQQPQWANLGQPEQIDISPAVGAFQSRFMQGSQGGPAHVAPNMPEVMPHEAPDAMRANKGGMKSL